MVTFCFSSEIILYDVAWSDDEHLFAMWMNRIQNKSHLVHYHISNNTVEVKEVSSNTAIEIYIT